MKIFSTEWLAKLIGTDAFNSKTKTKYAFRGNSATRTTAGVFSTGTFNNLEVGKRYRYIARFYGNIGGGASVGVGLRHGAGFIETASMETQGTIGADKQSVTCFQVFVATETTLTAELITVTTSQNAMLYFMTLEELPNHESTTQWD
jgi:hypothetical protein